MRHASLLLLLVGCAPRLYTDASDADTDGVDPAWTAPENTWPVGAPPEGLVGEGMDAGDVVLDVRGTDQFGDEVSLWQFHDRWVLVDISTMWCAPCQDLARGTEDLYQAYRDRGLVYLTLLHENVGNDPPTVDDLALWARMPEGGEGAYDLITAPVVADPKGRSGSIQAIRANQYPVVLLVDTELKVEVRVEPPTEERIVEVLTERLGAP